MTLTGMCKSRHNYAGFTLVELLTVVLILGIVTAVVLPQIGSHDDLKVASAARALAADLLYAQSQAIATGKTHYVVFNAVRATYALMDRIDPPNVLVHPTLSIPYELGFGSGPLEGVTLAEVSFDGETTLAFDALGTPHSCTAPAGKLSALNVAAIVLRSGDYKLTVTIQPGSGEIKVQ
jgi:prepilin-type N-terminal cleavage/methylation domain-containing protein